jgi:hypothetical protein
MLIPLLYLSNFIDLLDMYLTHLLVTGSVDYTKLVKVKWKDKKSNAYLAAPFSIFAHFLISEDVVGVLI